MRNLVKMTDEKIEKKFKELGYPNINMNEVYGEPEVFFTKETLDDFEEASKNYLAGNNKKRTDKTLTIDNVKITKGAQAFYLAVIDFGKVRGVYKT